MICAECMFMCSNPKLGTGSGITGPMFMLYKQAISQLNRSTGEVRMGALLLTAAGLVMTHMCKLTGWLLHVALHTSSGA
jgi:hypothetical protein